MVKARHRLIFPEGTLFFQMDGVLFTCLAEARWCALDDGGNLVPLSEAYAAEIGRMVDQCELIDEATFRAALAPDAVLPAEPAG